MGFPWDAAVTYRPGCRLGPRAIRAASVQLAELKAFPWGFDVTIPVIAPALVAGWLLAFTLSLDDLVVASFVTGPGASTLPMVIFSKVRLGVSPDINALATIIIAIVALGVGIASWQMRRSMRRD